VSDGQQKAGIDAAGEGDDRGLELAEQRSKPLELAGEVGRQMPSAWNSSVVR
jgi:hypothetical protein